MPLLAGMTPFVWFHCPGDKYAVRSILMGAENDCIRIFLYCDYFYVHEVSVLVHFAGKLTVTIRIDASSMKATSQSALWLTLPLMRFQHSILGCCWVGEPIFTSFKLVLLSIWTCT